MPTFDRLPQLDQPAPVAEQRPHTETHHGRSFDDPYQWLRDPGYPEVTDEAILDHLRAENAYLQTFLDSNVDLVDTLFEEFKGRLDETDTSVPYVRNGYEYQWAYNAGDEYRTHSRRPLGSDDWTVVLDEPALADGHEYFVLGGWTISPDNRLLAHAVDTSGDERCVARIRDLETGELLDDELVDVQGGLTFSANSDALIYVELDPDRWFGRRVRAHTIGTPQADDRILFEENDESFFIGFDKTSSREYLLISSERGESQETWAMPADLSAPLTLLISRDADCTQVIDHAHGDFHVLVNDTHKNFRLATVRDTDPAHENWETVIEGDDGVHWLDIQCFERHIALKSRDRGEDRVHLRSYDGTSRTVEFPSRVGVAGIDVNPEFDQAHLRVRYESMVTPPTIYDVDVETLELTSRKVANIPSGYDETQYRTERIMATARDGVEIPVSLVMRTDWEHDASRPLWLYGYGAYGITVSPTFSTDRLSALDRGFAFAIAHVRGGAMMGYPWYLDGKLDKRTNTFNDFVDVANHLVAENYVAAGNISITGRSAGGELMGAVTLQAPELWRSVNLGVPFVDVLATMLDASLPLTPPEWAEWGNPLESAEDYDLIAGYSPYNNITAREYPPMFVSGGLNDPRVTYWEPAKWTARMRELKTDTNLLVMRMNMGAGHFANSGRYGRLRDLAEEYAFMLKAHGITE